MLNFILTRNGCPCIIQLWNLSVDSLGRKVCRRESWLLTVDLVCEAPSRLKSPAGSNPCGYHSCHLLTPARFKCTGITQQAQQVYDSKWLVRSTHRFWNTRGQSGSGDEFNDARIGRHARQGPKRIPEPGIRSQNEDIAASA